MSLNDQHPSLSTQQQQHQLDQLLPVDRSDSLSNNNDNHPFQKSASTERLHHHDDDEDEHDDDHEHEQDDNHRRSSTSTSIPQHELPPSSSSSTSSKSSSKEKTKKSPPTVSSNSSSSSCSSSSSSSSISISSSSSFSSASPVIRNEFSLIPLPRIQQQTSSLSHRNLETFATDNPTTTTSITTRSSNNDTKEPETTTVTPTRRGAINMAATLKSLRLQPPPVNHNHHQNGGDQESSSSSSSSTATTSSGGKSKSSSSTSTSSASSSTRNSDNHHPVRDARRSDPGGEPDWSFLEDLQAGTAILPQGSSFPMEHPQYCAPTKTTSLELKKRLSILSHIPPLADDHCDDNSMDLIYVASDQKIVHRLDDARERIPLNDDNDDKLLVVVDTPRDIETTFEYELAVLGIPLHIGGSGVDDGQDDVGGEESDISMGELSYLRDLEHQNAESEIRKQQQAVFERAYELFTAILEERNLPESDPESQVLFFVILNELQSEQAIVSETMELDPLRIQETKERVIVGAEAGTTAAANIVSTDSVDEAANAVVDIGSEQHFDACTKETVQNGIAPVDDREIIQPTTIDDGATMEQLDAVDMKGATEQIHECGADGQVEDSSSSMETLSECNDGTMPRTKVSNSTEILLGIVEPNSPSVGQSDPDKKETVSTPPFNNSNNKESEERIPYTDGGEAVQPAWESKACEQSDDETVEHTREDDGATEQKEPTTPQGISEEEQQPLSAFQLAKRRFLLGAAESAKMTPGRSRDRIKPGKLDIAKEWPVGGGGLLTPGKERPESVRISSSTFASAKRAFALAPPPSNSPMAEQRESSRQISPLIFWPQLIDDTDLNLLTVTNLHLGQKESQHEVVSVVAAGSTAANDSAFSSDAYTADVGSEENDQTTIVEKLPHGVDPSIDQDQVDAPRIDVSKDMKSECQLCDDDESDVTYETIDDEDSDGSSDDDSNIIYEEIDNENGMNTTVVEEFDDGSLETIPEDDSEFSYDVLYEEISEAEYDKDTTMHGPAQNYIGVSRVGLNAEYTEEVEDDEYSYETVEVENISFEEAPIDDSKSIEKDEKEMDSTSHWIEETVHDPGPWIEETVHSVDLGLTSHWIEETVHSIAMYSDDSFSVDSFAERESLEDSATDRNMATVVESYDEKNSVTPNEKVEFNRGSKAAFISHNEPPSVSATTKAILSGDISSQYMPSKGVLTKEIAMPVKAAIAVKEMTANDVTIEDVAVQDTIVKDTVVKDAAVKDVVLKEVVATEDHNVSTSTKGTPALQIVTVAMSSVKPIVSAKAIAAKYVAALSSEKKIISPDQPKIAASANDTPPTVAALPVKVYAKDISTKDVAAPANVKRTESPDESKTTASSNGTPPKDVAALPIVSVARSPVEPDVKPNSKAIATRDVISSPAVNIIISPDETITTAPIYDVPVKDVAALPIATVATSPETKVEAYVKAFATNGIATPSMVQNTMSPIVPKVAIAKMAIAATTVTEEEPDALLVVLEKNLNKGLVTSDDTYTHLDEIGKIPRSSEGPGPAVPEEDTQPGTKTESSPVFRQAKSDDLVLVAGQWKKKKLKLAAGDEAGQLVAPTPVPKKGNTKSPSLLSNDSENSMPATHTQGEDKKKSTIVRKIVKKKKDGTIVSTTVAQTKNVYGQAPESESLTTKRVWKKPANSSSSPFFNDGAGDQGWKKPIQRVPTKKHDGPSSTISASETTSLTLESEKKTRLVTMIKVPIDISSGLASVVKHSDGVQQSKKKKKKSSDSIDTGVVVIKDGVRKRVMKKTKPTTLDSSEQSALIKIDPEAKKSQNGQGHSKNEIDSVVSPNRLKKVRKKPLSTSLPPWGMSPLLKEDEKITNTPKATGATDNVHFTKTSSPKPKIEEIFEAPTIQANSVKQQSKPVSFKKQTVGGESPADSVASISKTPERVSKPLRSSILNGKNQDPATMTIDAKSNMYPNFEPPPTPPKELRGTSIAPVPFKEDMKESNAFTIPVQLSPLIPSKAWGKNPLVESSNSPKKPSLTHSVKGHTSSIKPINKVEAVGPVEKRGKKENDKLTPVGPTRKLDETTAASWTDPTPFKNSRSVLEGAQISPVKKWGQSLASPSSPTNKRAIKDDPLDSTATLVVSPVKTLGNPLVVASIESKSIDATSMSTVKKWGKPIAAATATTDSIPTSTVKTWGKPISSTPLTPVKATKPDGLLLSPRRKSAGAITTTNVKKVVLNQPVDDTKEKNPIAKTVATKTIAKNTSGDLETSRSNNISQIGPTASPVKKKLINKTTVVEESEKAKKVSKSTDFNSYSDNMPETPSKVGKKRITAMTADSAIVDTTTSICPPETPKKNDITKHVSAKTGATSGRTYASTSSNPPETTRKYGVTKHVSAKTTDSTNVTTSSCNPPETPKKNVVPKYLSTKITDTTNDISSTTAGDTTKTPKKVVVKKAVSIKTGSSSNPPDTPTRIAMVKHTVVKGATTSARAVPSPTTTTTVVTPKTEKKVVVKKIVKKAVGVKTPKKSGLDLSSAWS